MTPRIMYIEREAGNLIGEDYWISGCKRDGRDRLYGERLPVPIDEDVREEYWTQIRKLPEKGDCPNAWP
jgi:hypothetical protein